MLVSLLYLAAGLGLLYVGGESLVKGAAGLALRFGLTPLAVGLTVVAFGTSAPELAVCLGAAFQGQGDLALGNVVGSNIGNVGLILGLTALIRPVAVHLQVLRFDLPLLAAVSIGFVLTVLDGRLGRIEGAVLVAGLVLYVATVLRLSRRETRAVRAEFEAGIAAEVAADVPETTAGRVWVLALMVAAGVGLLVLGGQAFVEGSVRFAERLGVPKAVIALTLVAVGTSLPELATGLVAAARGQGDIAVGNVVGSNLFNILSIAGLTGLIRPIAAPGLTPVDLGAMLLFSLALFPLIYVGGRQRVGRREGALLLAAYACYVGWLAATSRDIPV